MRRNSLAWLGVFAVIILASGILTGCGSKEGTSGTTLKGMGLTLEARFIGPSQIRVEWEGINPSSGASFFPEISGTLTNTSSYTIRFTTLKATLRDRQGAILRSADSQSTLTPTWSKREIEPHGSFTFIEQLYYFSDPENSRTFEIEMVDAEVVGGPSETEQIVTPSPTQHVSNQAKVSWKTSTVSLEADSFYIIADNKKFIGDHTTMSINSDPGDATYTSLELMWREQGVEMRLYFYFSSDGQEWWSNEIDTYNGKPDGDWITYQGNFFRNRLGSSYSGDVELQSSPNNRYSGKIHFENLVLRAFQDQSPASSVTTPTATPEMTYIRIGVIGPMQSQMGKAQWMGATLAADQINAAGGVKVGDAYYQIELIQVDTNELVSAADASTAAERAITVDNIDFLIGTTTSEGALAVQQVAMSYQKIFIESDSSETTTYSTYSTYDAVYILKEAVEGAGSLERDAIIAEMEKAN